MAASAVFLSSTAFCSGVVESLAGDSRSWVRDREEVMRSKRASLVKDPLSTKVWEMLSH